MVRFIQYHILNLYVLNVMVWILMRFEFLFAVFRALNLMSHDISKVRSALYVYL